MRSVNVMVAIVLSAAALAMPAAAQQSQEFGDYEIHYNTLNTNQLSPDIASVYGIQRAGTRAMLNITVLDKGTREPVKASITATATNLTGQRREIDLQPIDDQGAIYYIGQFRIHDQETLNFDVEIKPDGHNGEAFDLSFRQQFFTG